MVVPPDILNEPDLNTGSLDEGITNEGGQVQLVCIATGVPGKSHPKELNLMHGVRDFNKLIYSPEPSVQWRREGGKDIVLRSEGRDKQCNLAKESILFVYPPTK